MFFSKHLVCVFAPPGSKVTTIKGSLLTDVLSFLYCAALSVKGGHKCCSCSGGGSASPST